MRPRDERKEQAICDASISLITSKGLADTSMSMIARKAKVSPATIYIYFTNKEDLLNQLYYRLKRALRKKVFTGYESFLPLDQAFETTWENMYNYFLTHPEHFAFLEQFDHSPLVLRINEEEGNTYYQPIYELFEKGKRNRMIRDLPNEVLLSFTFHPMIQLVKFHNTGAFSMNDHELSSAARMAWDTIRTR